jgi:DNA-binding CsgD family transcriptional regulator
MTPDDGTGSFQEWFDLDSTARLIVSRDLRVRQINKSAHQFFEAPHVLRIRDGVMTAAERQMVAKLARWIAHSTPQPRALVIGEVIICGQGVGAADGVVALWLRDASEDYELKCADLEPVFGLTPAEQQTLVLLLQGLGPQEVADRLNNSVLTIRTHVKRLYAKLDVRSRGQLFVRVAPYLFIT